MLGGCSGLSLNRIASTIIGTDTIMASTRRNCLMSSTELYLLIMKLGTEAPNVKDKRLIRIPVNVIIPTFSCRNQLRATLLGVFRMNMLPTDANPDPSRQKIDCLTSNNSLNQTPTTRKLDPSMKEMRMPYLLMTQLQGKANSGCPMVKRRALRVTSVSLMSNLSSTTTLMLEKVWTGRELTNAAMK